MRKLVTGLALTVAFGASPLLAQAPSATSFDKEPAPPVSRAPNSVGQRAYEKDSLSTNQPMTAAQQRIFERASIEAHERLARIETRHREGVSIQRPAIYSVGITTPNAFWHGNWHYRAYP